MVTMVSRHTVLFISLVFVAMIGRNHTQGTNCDYNKRVSHISRTIYINSKSSSACITFQMKTGHMYEVKVDDAYNLRKITVVGNEFDVQDHSKIHFIMAMSDGYRMFLVGRKPIIASIRIGEVSGRCQTSYRIEENYYTRTLVYKPAKWESVETGTRVICYYEIMLGKINVPFLIKNRHNNVQMEIQVEDDWEKMEDSINVTNGQLIKLTEITRGKAHTPVHFTYRQNCSFEISINVDKTTEPQTVSSGEKFSTYCVIQFRVRTAVRVELEFKNLSNVDWILSGNTNFTIQNGKPKHFITNITDGQEMVVMRKEVDRFSLDITYTIDKGICEPSYTIGTDPYIGTFGYKPGEFDKIVPGTVVECIWIIRNAGKYMTFLITNKHETDIIERRKGDQWVRMNMWFFIEGNTEIKLRQTNTNGSFESVGYKYRSRCYKEISMNGNETSGSTRIHSRRPFAKYCEIRFKVSSNIMVEFEFNKSRHVKKIQSGDEILYFNDGSPKLFISEVTDGQQMIVRGSRKFKITITYTKVGGECSPKNDIIHTDNVSDMLKYEPALFEEIKPNTYIICNWELEPTDKYSKFFIEKIPDNVEIEIKNAEDWEKVEGSFSLKNRTYIKMKQKYNGVLATVGFTFRPANTTQETTTTLKPSTSITAIPTTTKTTKQTTTTLKPSTSITAMPATTKTTKETTTILKPSTSTTAMPTTTKTTKETTTTLKPSSSTTAMPTTSGQSSVQCYLTGLIALFVVVHVTVQTFNGS